MRRRALLLAALLVVPAAATTIDDAWKEELQQTMEENKREMEQKMAEMDRDMEEMESDVSHDTAADRDEMMHPSTTSRSAKNIHTSPHAADDRQRNTVVSKDRKTRKSYYKKTVKYPKKSDNRTADRNDTNRTQPDDHDEPGVAVNKTNRTDTDDGADGDTIDLGDRFTIKLITTFTDLETNSTASITVDQDDDRVVDTATDLNDPRLGVDQNVSAEENELRIEQHVERQ